MGIKQCYLPPDRGDILGFGLDILTTTKNDILTSSLRSKWKSYTGKRLAINRRQFVRELQKTVLFARAQ